MNPYMYVYGFLMKYLIIEHKKKDEKLIDI